VTSQCWIGPATGRYRTFESPSVPFGPFPVTSGEETHVEAACSDSDDTLVGVRTNDTDAAVSWAEPTYRRFRERTTEFTDECAEEAAAEAQSSSDWS
jgi:hypothetical protein